MFITYLQILNNSRANTNSKKMMQMQKFTNDIRIL
jgi:hypothetical protein